VTTHACASCDATVTDAGIVCQGCWKRTIRILQQLPGLLADLEITITGQANLPVRSSGGGGAMWDQKAAALRDEIRAGLIGWCRVLHEDQRMTLPHDRITSMCNAIGHSGLRMHEAAGEACDEIGAWPARIAQAVDWPEERSVTKLGRCTRTGDGWECEGEIHVHHPMTGPPYVLCHACQGRWETVEQLEQLGMEVRSRRAVVRLHRAIFGDTQKAG